ncbi:ABC transporter substrate-binding protein [Bradyrhizobium sp. CB82]|uniref:ABC transporter substrate-binding protein n=1 Tax=Bradyrhizobium sp. CB82 TaxID=3039159 RepID=UPI0024B084FA|nr:ABC transporter substrate-binding protein [Bradyrhizobium sp. CB82]WFU39981.1 ABC transporter substrate-binding protein [Bradyrhizobium sp. CB82]
MDSEAPKTATQFSARFTRRRTLAVGGGVALGAVLGPVAMLDRARAASKTLTVEIASGTVGSCYREAYLQPFERETGIEVLTVPENYNDSKFKLAANSHNYIADVMYVETFLPYSPDAAKYLEPIDYSVINREELIPELAQTYTVADGTYATTLGYNTEKTGGRIPIGWVDFFDVQKFPGKRGVNNDALQMPIVALLADGVDPKDLVPLDFDRAFKKLDTIRKEMVFFSGGAQAQDLLSSGETPLSVSYASRVVAARADGKPVAQVWNGFLVVGNTWAIPKGNPNKETAMKYLAFVLSRKINARISSCSVTSPSNKYSKIESKWEDDLPFRHLDKPHILLNSPQIASWIGSHQAEINERYQHWKAG